MTGYDIREVLPEVFRIPVPLEGNPLKELNSYLFRGSRETKQRNLLVDTGFRTEGCKKALLKGLEQLGVSMEDTDILLLDEPTSSLDIHNQYQVLKIVREICHKDGLSAIVVIHDLNLALRFCDRFLLLRQGQVYDAGDWQGLTPPALKQVYQVNGRVLDVEGRKMVLVEE